MSNIVAWTLFSLGVLHIPFGIFKFKAAFAAAVNAGFVDQFRVHEDRRAAFWFTMLGPLFMLAGQTAIHAVAVGDLALLKIVGIYVLMISIICVIAVPKSGFWATLLVSPLIIAAGYGLYA
ncbi:MULTISPECIES: DUF6463 family protein [unclassified Pseudomonas]|uniref:DUF6463 family protein n=1 Tax=unclassified Pseudomonas TaxID=196821 RepID=UPI000C86A5D0|nr:MULTISPECIES: DUF6463 family protein [unclassified Pseudomonas]PMV83639.1 hypothetical protein C1X56_26290 [Pseudomonas sp. GW101-1A09]PMV93782.1 hypothetical protein C1X51_14580 [Pseudomonas sp. FW306-2-2C-B10A]PMV97735.1 hypothetical protein C1X55_16520 [Pseudomonas sp. GW460-C8]PMW01814.1 hypothetical protein C1X50_26020 [Pseudomonas sp. MPR-TSA4]PMW21363.1 hypothetical protein C1X53_15815 [Pseudomonas sp. GW456-E6]